MEEEEEEKDDDDDYPTNIGATRAAPTATPLVVISDGGSKLGCSRLLQGFLLLTIFNTCSRVGTTRH